MTAQKHYGLVIFDLDGTLVTTKSGATFRKAADDWEFLPGRKERIAQLQGDGVKVAIATNQGGVAFGYMDEQEIAREVERTVQELSDNAAWWIQPYMCSHHPKGTVPGKATDCHRRKPKPGMLLAAMDDAHALHEETLMVGDRPEDLEAAQAARVDFQWADKFFRDS